jgi:hypothetical protein
MSDPKPSVATPPSNTPAGPATPAGPSAPTADDSRPQYEFDDAQNRVIADLARAILWVRVPLLVAGIFQALIATGLAFRIPRDGAHIVGVLGHALAAVVCFLLASWLLRAAAGFARITTTQGRDVTHLMGALGNLRSWFDLLAFFVKLYLVLLGVVILILLIGLWTNAFVQPPPPEGLTVPPEEIPTAQ